MTKQQIIRTDKAGRDYYLCICDKCGLRKEIRADHIENTKHKCKPVYRIELNVSLKDVCNASVKKMTVTAKNQKELNRKVKEIEQIYLITL